MDILTQFFTQDGQIKNRLADLTSRDFYRDALCRHRFNEMFVAGTQGDGDGINYNGCIEIFNFDNSIISLNYATKNPTFTIVNQNHQMSTQLPSLRPGYNGGHSIANPSYADNPMGRIIIDGRVDGYDETSHSSFVQYSFPEDVANKDFKVRSLIKSPPIVSGDRFNDCFSISIFDDTPVKRWIWEDGTFGIGTPYIGISVMINPESGSIYLICHADSSFFRGYDNPYHIDNIAENSAIDMNVETIPVNIDDGKWHLYEMVFRKEGSLEVLIDGISLGIGTSAYGPWLEGFIKPYASLIIDSNGSNDSFWVDSLAVGPA